MHAKIAAIAGIFILSMSGCATVRVASKSGRSACTNHIAADFPLASQSEKQAEYRRCLLTIDAKLADLNRLKKLEEEASAKQAEAKRRRQQAEWSTPQERLVHCKLRQNEVIDLERRRVRAYGEVLAANNSSLALDDKQKVNAQAKYDEIKRELDQLVPSNMRAGLPLIPEAIKVFSSCNPNDFR